MGICYVAITGGCGDHTSYKAKAKQYTSFLLKKKIEPEGGLGISQWWMCVE